MWGLTPKLGRSLGKEMATHSSVLAWKIAWTEGSGGLQSTGSQRVKYDWACMHAFCIHPYPVLPTNSFKAKKVFLNFLNTCYAMEDKILRLYKKNQDSVLSLNFNGEQNTFWLFWVFLKPWTRGCSHEPHWRNNVFTMSQGLWKQYIWFSKLIWIH